MPHAWTLMVLLGLSAGTLVGCYVVSPTAYPLYPSPPPPPSYPAPPTAYPAPPTGPPAAPASPGTPAPAAGASLQGGAGPGRRCETVLVEAHWETLVRPDRQAERVWVPARSVQECR
jgi:hypothetical protein